MKEKIEKKGITKSEMVELLSVLKDEIRYETKELLNMMTKQISEQFTVVFEQIDSSAETLRAEFKSEIRDLRKDMNKRLSSIENNMVYNYEHEALAKRVKKLETVNA